MNLLWELVKKEIKETFRNPRYIVFTVLFPLIIFPAIGYLYNLGFQTAQERIATLTVYVVDLDQDEVSQKFIQYLRDRNITVELVEPDQIDKLDYVVLFILPENLTESYLSGERGSIEIKVRIGSVSFSSMGVLDIGNRLVAGFEAYLRREAMIGAGLDADFLNDIFSTDVYVRVEDWGMELPSQQLASLFIQIFIMPWVVFGLVVSILQVSAAMLSEEKEYKTLETLLTLPIDRKILALEKIMGSMIVAFAATAAYAVGFLIYVAMLGFGTRFTVTSGEGLDIIEESLSISLRPEVLLLLTLLFFLTVLITGGIGLLVSLFTQDTKTAEGVAATVSMPIMMIILLGALIDLSLLPDYARMIYFSIPYVYLMKSFEYLIIGRYEMYVVGIIVNIVWLVVVMVILARMFESERILTMKISFKLGVKRRLFS